MFTAMVRSYKVGFVGDSQIGKTSLLMKKENQYRKSFFCATSESVMYNEKEFELNLFEVPNSEAFNIHDNVGPLNPFADCHLWVCTFSIGHPESFANVERKWIPNLRSYHPKVPILLLGLKSDLRNAKEHAEKLESKPITFEEGTNLMQKMGCINYHECSTKSTEGLHELFENVLVEACEKNEERFSFIKMLCEAKELPRHLKSRIRHDPHLMSDIIMELETANSFMNMVPDNVQLQTLELLFEVDSKVHHELITNIKDAKGRNLFHVSSRSNPLFNHLWLKLSPKERSRLILAQDTTPAKTCPFIQLAYSDNDNCIHIWEEFEKLLDDNHQLEIDSLFKKHSEKQQTILDLCGRQFDLFSKICKSKHVGQDVKDSIGLKILDLMCDITEEKYLRNLMEQFWKEFAKEFQRKVFHHICANNLNELLHYVKSSTPTDHFLNLILSSGNCILHGATIKL